MIAQPTRLAPVPSSPAALDLAARRAAATAFEPQNLEQLIEYGKMMAQSSAIAEAYRGSPANVILVVQLGREIGFTAAQSLVSFAIVGTTPTLYGDSLLAVVRASPLCEEIDEWMEVDEDNPEDFTQWEAVCMARRRGAPKPVIRRFSQKQAVTAKLWGKKTKLGYDTPWITNPDRMLQMRARRFALADLFPDVMRGIKMYEEVIDYGEVDVTGSAPAATPTRAETTRDRLRDAAAQVGELEAPMPNFGMMLNPQVREIVEKEAFDRGMPPKELAALVREISPRGLGSRNAEAVVKAIRRWVAPVVADPPAEGAAPAAPAGETGTQPNLLGSETQ